MDKPNMELDPANSLLTVHDLAGYLRLSEAKVYRMANAGLVPACRVGNSWRFKKDVIDDWIRKKIEAGFHVQS
jgi:excisionase family DNA binding protein